MSGKQSDFDILMEHGLDIRGRVIYLQGEIEASSVHKFIKALRYLDKTVGKITIILDSEGGDVNLGFAAHDAIKLCGNEVEIKVVGNVMSIATIILQAGDRRLMTKNSRLMLHRGEIELGDHITNVKRALKESDEIEEAMMDTYMEKIREVKPKFKRSQLRTMLDYDTFLSAKKSLELGLIDEIDS
jgi:ATP-dependent protease ClpP protease subunit